MVEGHEMYFTIRQGMDIPIEGEPQQIISDGAKISSVGLTSGDLRRLYPKFLVHAGDQIALGQPLFSDRDDPDVVFVAPAAGRVVRIDRNSRRGFRTLEIACEDDEAVSFDCTGDVRSILQKSGLWTALTARPFGTIPRAIEIAEAILVTAVDTNPLAANPAVIIEAAKQDFECGLEKLVALECGQVIVCQGSGAPLVKNLGDAVKLATFKGRHPAGLPGTHLDRLGYGGRPVWQIGYQDVIAIGFLFRHQRISAERVVAIGGPKARNPRLLRTQRSANLADLIKDEMTEGDVTTFSGSVLSGRPSAFLGHLHLQVSLMSVPTDRAQHAYAQHENLLNLTPIVPTEAFEAVLPQKILPVPLMRALAVGDRETARRLGASDLLEEDLALLSALCTSGLDYGALLRRALDDYAGVSK